MYTHIDEIEKNKQITFYAGMRTLLLISRIHVKIHLVARSVILVSETGAFPEVLRTSQLSVHSSRQQPLSEGSMLHTSRNTEPTHQESVPKGPWKDGTDSGGFQVNTRDEGERHILNSQHACPVRTGQSLSCHHLRGEDLKHGGPWTQENGEYGVFQDPKNASCYFQIFCFSLLEDDPVLMVLNSKVKWRVLSWLLSDFCRE